MKPVKRFIGIIPPWAFVLIIITISVNTAFLITRYRTPIGGATGRFEKDYFIHDYVIPRGSVDRAGIRPGDTLVSMNAIPVEKWQNNEMVGDTVIAGILRNNREVAMPVIVDSVHSYAPGYFYFMYIFVVLFSIGSLFLLFKRSHDQSARLFFIIIQLFLIIVNAISYHHKAPLAMIAVSVFHLSGCFVGTVLIHFHLLFPRPAKFFFQVNKLLIIFYAFSFLIFTGYSISYYYFLFPGKFTGQYYGLFDRIVVSWMTLNYSLALAVAVFQFRTIKDTLTRNQLRIVITGSVFGFLVPAFLSVFYNSLDQLSARHPLMIPVIQGTATLILICCILVAIFRYRIWDIEVFIRKALLYLGATLVIILSYLVLLYLVDLSTIGETRVTRFIILAISVIIFLALRDRIQRLIERIFHREPYDSATVVSDFEEKLAGIYRDDELKPGIVQGMDEIFHFSSVVFLLKKHGLIYEPVSASGLDHLMMNKECIITQELETRLYRSQIFSLGELDHKISFLDVAHGELVVPLVKDGQPYGFFLCGPKKSEKTYSMQDIRVLSLIAKRVIALFHTAGLYQKDLDRQLILERERARISQDMHDDVGASLTRISMMSDLVKNRTDVGVGALQWLGQISDTSRGLMEEMNQIIWALNPRNDNLEGLITYIRRFAFEYLEPTTVDCVFDLPELMPDRALSVEVRRNVYLVAREAIHNVVKHAGAAKVRINLEMNEHGFKITIKDDGHGFDPGKLEFPGNGLVSMKNRMSDIDGEFLIYSKAGEGTEIVLVVK